MISINFEEGGSSMSVQQIPKPLAKVLALSLAAAAVSTAAIAAPITYSESPAGTGNMTVTAEVIAGGAESGLTILGNLLDGRGGFAPNLVDLYRFSVGQAGMYFFNSFGTSIADPQMFLFDNAGNGLYWNNDASLAPSNTQSAFSTVLGMGDYYVALSFYGVDPDDGINLIFDTLGSNEGPAVAGAGALAGWQDAFGQTIWDNTAYRINIEVPEPGALALTLAALGLMAGFSRRRAVGQA